jgi:hypothetical protein
MATLFAAETAAFPANRNTCSPGLFSPFSPSFENASGELPQMTKPQKLVYHQEMRARGSLAAALKRFAPKNP